MTDRGRAFMGRALELAREAEAEGEVPVGAIVVRNGEIIGSGYNRCIALNDPTAHAEILAIREACEHVGNYRLAEAALYSTLEPCVMCAGAILAARIEHVVFAARDERAGAAGSILNLLETPMLNHRCRVTTGIESDAARELLRVFFKQRRGEGQGG